MNSAKDSIDYEQTLAYLFVLHEVRFKLLGFLPLLTGAAVTYASGTMNTTFRLALACFGLTITIGVISYDMRNTQIYDQLIKRAKLLERKLRFAPFPSERFGGPIYSRPPLQEVLGIKLVWHIQGLAIIYSASIAAWFFLGASATNASPIFIATLTAYVFAASYLLYRVISWIHHAHTLKIKKLMGDN